MSELWICERCGHEEEGEKSKPPASWRVLEANDVCETCYADFKAWWAFGATPPGERETVP